jgi:predicted transcriptional regulator
MAEDRILSIEIRPDGSLGAEEREAVHPAAEGGKPAGAASPRQLMRLFSGRNVELLLLIKRERPQSVAELARLSNRPKESLTRTLQRLASLGIVEMQKAPGRGKAPTVRCDRLRLELPLDQVDRNAECAALALPVVRK